MGAIKITEELVILMALRNFIDDYRSFLESTLEKNTGTELIEALMAIAEQAYFRKLQNVPEYEDIINKYLYEDSEGGYGSTDGYDIPDENPTGEF